MMADAGNVATSDDGSFLALDGSYFPAVGGPDSWEQVLAGFLANGDRSLDELQIEGAVVGWHAPSRRLILYRDRFGVAPVYHVEIDGGVAFASDLESLLRAGVAPQVDLVALDQFLSHGYFVAPRSPITGVTKIPPGHTVVISDGAITETRRWGWGPENGTPIDSDEAEEPFLELFERALVRRWPAAGQAALLLSGGVDSATILAGVVRLLDGAIDTFTFEYTDYEGALNEGRNARAIADHFGAPHQHIVVTPDDLWNDLDDAVAAYGEPLTWGLHSYRLGGLAADGYTTMFSGAGPDGWGLSRRHRAALRFMSLPKPARSVIRGVVRAAGVLPVDRRGRVRWTTRPAADVAELFSPDGDDHERLRRSLYLDPEIAATGRRDALEIFRSAVRDMEGASPERALVLLDKRFTTAEQIVSWSTRWTRAHDLSLQLPYLDHELVSLAMRIRGPKTGKDVLRQIAARWMPPEMAYAPKIPQQMPIGGWLRGPLSDRVTERLSSLPPEMAEVFDQAAVTSVARDHIAGRAEHGWLLVALLTTAAWFEQLAALANRRKD